MKILKNSTTTAHLFWNMKQRFLQYVWSQIIRAHPCCFIQCDFFILYTVACFLAFLFILTNCYHTAKEMLIPDAWSCIIYRHPVVKLVWVCIVVSFGRRGFVRCPRVGRMNAADLFSNILTYTCISIVAAVCIFSPSVWYIIDFPQKISCHFFFFQSCNRLKKKMNQRSESEVLLQIPTTLALRMGFSQLTADFLQRVIAKWLLLSLWTTKHKTKF